MQIIAGIIYFGVGLVQLAATMAGLEQWLGLHWLIAVPLAMILAYVPLVGTIVGMFGAVHAWGWEWWQAGALFFGALALTVVLFALANLVESVGRRRAT